VRRGTGASYRVGVVRRSPASERMGRRAVRRCGGGAFPLDSLDFRGAVEWQRPRVALPTPSEAMS